MVLKLFLLRIYVTFGLPRSPTVFQPIRTCLIFKTAVLTERIGNGSNRLLAYVNKQIIEPALYRYPPCRIYGI
jgi:hypothetical protein